MRAALANARGADVAPVKAAFTKALLYQSRAPIWCAFFPYGRRPELGRPAALAIGRPFLVRHHSFQRRPPALRGGMLLFFFKALVSGILVAAISTLARRYPGWGGLVASLPLVSVLSMLWLYGETRDVERVAQLSLGAFWFFLPSVPMFLIIPALLRAGVGFAPTMAVACGVTILLYAAMGWLAPRMGIAL